MNGLTFANARLIDPEQAVEAPGIGGRGPRLLPRSRLCEILQPRAIEILDLVAEGFTEPRRLLYGGNAIRRHRHR